MWMAKRRAEEVSPKVYGEYWIKPTTSLPYPFGTKYFCPDDMKRLVEILKVLVIKKQKYVTLILPLQIRWGALFGESSKRKDFDGNTRNSKTGRAAFTYRVNFLYNKLHEKGFIEQSLRELSFDTQWATREVNEVFSLFE